MSVFIKIQQENIGNIQLVTFQAFCSVFFHINSSIYYYFWSLFLSSYLICVVSLVLSSHCLYRFFCAQLLFLVWMMMIVIGILDTSLSYHFQSAVYFYSIVMFMFHHLSVMSHILRLPIGGFGSCLSVYFSFDFLVISSRPLQIILMY